MCLMPSQKHQIVVRLLRAVVFGADEPQATALDQQRHIHGPAPAYLLERLLVMSLPLTELLLVVGFRKADDEVQPQDFDQVELDLAELPARGVHQQVGGAIALVEPPDQLAADRPQCPLPQHALAEAVVEEACEPTVARVGQRAGLARYSPDLVLDFVQPGWRSSSRFP